MLSESNSNISENWYLTRVFTEFYGTPTTLGTAWYDYLNPETPSPTPMPTPTPKMKSGCD